MLRQQRPARPTTVIDLSRVVRFKAAEVEECAYDVLASCVLRRYLFYHGLNLGVLHRPALGCNVRGTEISIGREGRLDEEALRRPVNITDRTAVSVLKGTATLSEGKRRQHQADKRSGNPQVSPVHGQHSTPNLC